MEEGAPKHERGEVVPGRAAKVGSSFARSGVSAAAWQCHGSWHGWRVGSSEHSAEL